MPAGPGSFALVSADLLDRVLSAWPYTRAVQAGGRLVIAIDGKAVRGAKGKDGKAPHLVAALARPAPTWERQLQGLDAAGDLEAAPLTSLTL